MKTKTLLILAVVGIVSIFIAQFALAQSGTPGSESKLSVYYIPLNSQSGGVNVNIVDWLPSIDSGVVGYKIYKREFGATDWTLLADNGTKVRYFDDDIDTNIAYQYQVRPYSVNSDLVPIVSTISTNYLTRESDGLKPENVLVLVSTNPYGFVDIGSSVTGYNTANGKLGPVNEGQLCAFLGYSENDSSFWTSPDANGIVNNTKWHIIKDTNTGKIEAPLGVYYAIRRNIPKENILCLDNIPTGERDIMGSDNFNANVIQPIKEHMIEEGLTSKITSIVSSYHFPVVSYNTAAGSAAWDDALNYSLWTTMGGASSDIAEQYNLGRHFSRILGDAGYLATRIDAQDEITARRMIDDAIWSEENYDYGNSAWRQASDLKAFIDWGGRYPEGDAWFLQAAEIIASSGSFGAQGQNWDMAQNLNTIIAQYDQDHDGRLDNTFFYSGWYNIANYQDWFNWARGSIGWSLDSASGYSFRTSLAGWIWAGNIINRGACASLGATDEPYLGGHTRPSLFTYYMLNGYSFAEAGYYASNHFFTFYAPWKYAFDGDPMYSPFGNSSDWRLAEIDVGDDTVIRLTLGNGYNLVDPYRDYDLEGNLLREFLPNGVLISYLNDGKTAFYKVNKVASESSLADLWYYDADGNQIAHSEIALPFSDYYCNEIIELKDEYHPGSTELKVHISTSQFDIDFLYGITDGNAKGDIAFTSFINRDTGIDLLQNAVNKLKEVFNPDTYTVDSWAMQDSGIAFNFRLPDYSIIGISVNIQTGEPCIPAGTMNEAILKSRQDASEKLGIGIGEVHFNGYGYSETDLPSPGHDLEVRYYVNVSASCFDIMYQYDPVAKAADLISLNNRGAGIDFYWSAAHQLREIVSLSTYALDSWSMRNSGIAFNFKLQDDSVMRVVVDPVTGEPHGLMNLEKKELDKAIKDTLSYVSRNMKISTEQQSADERWEHDVYRDSHVNDFGWVNHDPDGSESAPEGTVSGDETWQHYVYRDVHHHMTLDHIEYQVGGSPGINDDYNVWEAYSDPDGSYNGHYASEDEYAVWELIGGHNEIVFDHTEFITGPLGTEDAYNIWTLFSDPDNSMNMTEQPINISVEKINWVNDNIRLPDDIVGIDCVLKATVGNYTVEMSYLHREGGFAGINETKTGLLNFINNETGADLLQNAADQLTEIMNPITYALDWGVQDSRIVLNFKLPDGSIVGVEVNPATVIGGIVEGENGPETPELMPEPGEISVPVSDPVVVPNPVEPNVPDQDGDPVISPPATYQPETTQKASAQSNTPATSPQQGTEAPTTPVWLQKLINESIAKQATLNASNKQTLVGRGHKMYRSFDALAEQAGMDLLSRLSDD